MLEGEEAHEGEMPEMEKFVEFWGGIWEREERTPNMQWMEEIRRQLHEKADQVNGFNITFEKVKKEKMMDSIWHRRNTRLLVEKARTSPKTINKSIHENQGR